jgi:Tfp pilus assembly major pilin PilA
MKTKQSGVTLIGFLVILMVVGFFGYMAMKLVPAYSEYGGVVKAMNGVASEGGGSQSLDGIRRDLMYKFSMQYVDDNTVTPADITITRNSGGASTLNVSYDKDIPFMYNIDFLVHFSKSVPLQGNVGQ